MRVDVRAIAARVLRVEADAILLDLTYANKQDGERRQQVVQRDAEKRNGD